MAVRRSTNTEASSSESSSESDAEDHLSDSASAADTHQPPSLHSPVASEHCVVLMRGVVWRSEEVEMMKLGQNLLRFWPNTFADRLVQPQGALQAHGGSHLIELALQTHL